MTLPLFETQNLTKNCNESLILAILFKENKHGYQIALDIEENSNGQFKFNHGTLYPILHKLEKEGLIKGTWKQEEAKRKRKYYSITKAGKEYAAAELDAWRQFSINLFGIIEDIEK